jgi:hypothetical protein
MVLALSATIDESWPLNNKPEVRWHEGLHERTSNPLTGQRMDVSACQREIVNLRVQTIQRK